MIGSRLWVAGTSSNSVTEESLLLSSLRGDFVWSSSTAGASIPFLIDRDKPNTAGFRLSKQEYLTEQDVSDMLPDWQSDDPRWFDKDFWHNAFTDCLVWEWIERDSKTCPYYGFYAYKTIDIMNGDCWIDESWPALCGIVSGYGKVHKHSLGFRSEFMSILAFFFNEEDGDDYMKIVPYSASVDMNSLPKITLAEYAEMISRKMQIPLISMSQAHDMEDNYASL